MALLLYQLAELPAALRTLSVRCPCYRLYTAAIGGSRPLGPGKPAAVYSGCMRIVRPLPAVAGSQADGPARRRARRAAGQWRTTDGVTRTAVRTSPADRLSI